MTPDLAIPDTCPPQVANCKPKGGRKNPTNFIAPMAYDSCGGNVSVVPVLEAPDEWEPTRPLARSEEREVFLIQAATRLVVWWQN